MKKGLVIVLGLLMTLGAVSSATAANNFVRYKVVVTVTTPEGDKTGSSVREAVAYTESRLIPQQGGTFYNITKGEAVVVNLGKKRPLLFVLLGQQREAKLVTEMFSKETSRIILRPDQYPQMVYFENLNNPKTVRSARRAKIEGGQWKDGLNYGGHVVSVWLDKKIFGKGVNLKSIAIEPTHDHITTGIEKYLPWLPKVKMTYLNGSNFSASNDLYASLGGSDFKRGIK